jgi:phthalate 3,4-dioxygenase ferredoxin reductase subunit
MAGDVTVIVGASIGGVRTAQALRSSDYSGRIILISDEAVLPYDKPPLSKGLLVGSTRTEDIGLLSEQEADQLDVELRLAQHAVGLDVDTNELRLAAGERVGYRHLVVATGARARPAPWPPRDGLHVIRTLDDSLRLRADLQNGGRLVIIGGGVVGAEVAATARSMGVAVTIVDCARAPMERVLGLQIGELFTELHERNGVRALFGVAVADLTGQRGEFCVRLTDGRELEGDYVVVAIGAIPNDDWLTASGLHIDNGVVCDQYCRAVDVPNVWAVGDVARWHNPRYGRQTRIEHWTNAVEQAAVVAHNITHPDDLLAYAPVEYVWTDQYDWKVRVAGSVGASEGRDVEVIATDAPSSRFAGLYSHRGEFTGLVAVNWPRALVVGRKALAEGAPYTEVKRTLQDLGQR